MHVIPVIKIKNFDLTPDLMQWEFSLDDPVIMQKLEAYGELKGYPQGHYITSLGPVLLASYSPDVTLTWGKREGYGPGANHTGTQDMGSTQSMVQAIRHGQTIFEGVLFQALRKFLLHGIIVPIDPPHETSLIVHIPPKPKLPVISNEFKTEQKKKPNNKGEKFPKKKKKKSGMYYSIKHKKMVKKKK